MNKMKSKQFTLSFSTVAIMLIAVFLLSKSRVSAGSLFFSSGTDVAIPDGTGIYVHSPITVSGAPSSATVTRIDWFMSIHHNDGRDLDVDLNDHTRTAAFKADLWKGTFLSGGTDSGVNPVRQGTITSGSLIGLPVNQIWYLAAAAVAAGDAGYIDAWNLTVYWADCSYSVSPTSASPGSGSGSGSFSVMVGSGCTWSASTAYSWIHTGSSGSGNGTVNYTIDANTSTGSRTGTITVGGQTFTINQPGITCSYSLSPTSASAGSSSGSGSFGVTVGGGCSWAPNSDATSWLHTSSSSSGNGTVNYTYDTNASTSPRTAHITVG